MKWLIIAFLLIAQAESLPTDYQEIFNKDWQREGAIKDGRIYDNNWQPKGYIKDERQYDNQWRPKANLPDQKQGGQK